MNMEIDAHEYWNIDAYEKGHVHVMREIHHHADYGREVGGWGRDPKKCTERDWGMGSSTI